MHIFNLIDTIDLIFRDGVNWQAFFQSFQQLSQQYRDESITIQAIERKHNGAFVIRLETSNISFEKRVLIERSAKDSYSENLKLLEAQVADYRSLLHDEIQHNSQLMTVVRTMAEKQGQTFNFNQSVGNVNASEVSISGDQVGIQNNCVQERSLTQAFDEIQQLWALFQSQYPSPDENEFAQELACKAQCDITFRQKLSNWGSKIAHTSSEEAAKVAGGEFAKRVIPHALSLLIGLL